ncbi:MAG: transposase [Burkholderiaceae bacterium]|nr:transposase [Burkholderiaceae bacterium]
MRGWGNEQGPLKAILFVLRTGVSWEDMPQETGLGSGMTFWRRLRNCKPQERGTVCV